MKNRFYLMPLAEQNQQSFYNKAIVEVSEDCQTLYSYETKIMTIYNNGTMVKHWNGWSSTTGKHIKAFSELNKKQYTMLKMV